MTNDSLLRLRIVEKGLMRFGDLLERGREMLIRFGEVWWFLVGLGYLLGWGGEMLRVLRKSGMIGRVW